jgi:hypothetical protein
MRTKFLFAGLCLLTGTLFAKPASTISAPPSPGFIVSHHFEGCNSFLDVSTSLSGAFKVIVSIQYFFGQVVEQDYFTSSNAASCNVTNWIPGPALKVEVFATATNTILQTDYYSIMPPCIVRQIRMIKFEIPEKYHGKVSNPEETEEEVSKDLQVQWKLEELDPETFEPIYTIDNPPCWHQYNTYNGENAFNGFDGYNLSSVAELDAGACSEDEGIFNKDNIYRITRSYYTPEDDWMSTSVIIGPGFEEVEVDEEEKSLSATATKELSATETELFTLAQIRENDIVQINTSTDIGTLEVYNISGNKMNTIALQNESFIYQLSVSGFAKGVYVVRMESGMQILTKKFTVD